MNRVLLLKAETESETIMDVICFRDVYSTYTKHSVTMVTCVRHHVSVIISPDTLERMHSPDFDFPMRRLLMQDYITKPVRSICFLSVGMTSCLLLSV